MLLLIPILTQIIFQVPSPFRYSVYFCGLFCFICTQTKRNQQKTHDRQPDIQTDSQTKNTQKKITHQQTVAIETHAHINTRHERHEPNTTPSDGRDGAAARGEILVDTRKKKKEANTLSSFSFLLHRDLQGQT